MSFEEETQKRVDANGENQLLISAARAFTQASLGPRYSYNFTWLGRPIIQYPQDIVAMQELIWRISRASLLKPALHMGGHSFFLHPCWS